MKNILYIFIALSAIILSSCSTEIEETAINGEATTITLTVEGAESRATASTPPARYIMEVYNEDGSPANVLAGNKNHAESTDGVFSAVFDRAKAYKCIFWADGNNYEFNAYNLQKIQILKGILSKEAFYGSANIEKGKNSALTVKLKRAVAKIVLNETENLDVKTKISLNFYGFSTFDASTGIASGSSTSYSASTEIVEGKTSGIIFECYAISTLAGTTQDITFWSKVPYENPDPAYLVSAVPLKQNYCTNLKGTFAKYTNKKITVSIDENWDAPNDVPYEWYLKGKESGKFEIGTAAQLREFANIVDRSISDNEIAGGIAQDNFTGKTVTLTADIDLKNEEWTPIGPFTREFKGTFDGNGKTVSNIKVTDTNYSGLFGAVWDAIIKNVTVSNIDFSATKGPLNAQYAMGSITGFSLNSLIMNCTVKGNIKISVNGYNLEPTCGGLCGFTKDTKFINCAVIPSNTDYNIECSTNVITIGGLIGRATAQSYIINCFTTASMKGVSKSYDCTIGGIYGQGIFTTLNSYASGDIKGEVLETKNYFLGGIGGSHGSGSCTAFVLSSKIEAAGTLTGSIVGKAFGDILSTTGTKNIYVNPNIKYLIGGKEQSFNSSFKTVTNLSASSSAPWWSLSGGQSIVDKLNEYVTANPTFTYNGTAIPLKKWKTGTSEKCPALLID